MFLDLHNGGLLEGRDVRLSDINADVIGCYLAVRDAPDAVIAALRTLEAGYRAGGAAHFYGCATGRSIRCGGRFTRRRSGGSATRRRSRRC